MTLFDATLEYIHYERHQDSLRATRINSFVQFIGVWPSPDYRRLRILWRRGLMSQSAAAPLCGGAICSL